MTTTATRLITLIMLLQRHPNQKAGELAGELGISVRTLHRYFTLLDEMWGELYREAARGALAKLGNLLPEQQRDEVLWARRDPAHCWRIPINPGHAVRAVLADSLHRKYFHFRERLGYAVEHAEISLNKIDLSLTNLYYAKYGQGAPLIIVPATISRIRDWQPLIRFMGQKFTTHFFELPGHGGSTPFPQSFSSKLVGKTVEDFIDALHYDTITLMGFSFGGILTLRVLNQIQSRIKKLVLLSPCISQHTLLYSPVRIMLLKIFIKIMIRRPSQAFLLKMMHNEVFVDYVLLMLKRWGQVEIYGSAMRNTLLSLPESTLDVLTYQINEILSTDPISEVTACDIPCVLGMSRLDPLLSFEKTKKYVLEKFNNVWVESFDLPYHQPPEPFTFEGLNREYGKLLEKFTS